VKRKAGGSSQGAKGNEMPIDTNATQAYVNAAAIGLKEHYDELLAQVCKTIDERFKAQEKASDLQQEMVTKKFEAQNEWRGAMSDREKTFITRADHESLVLLLNTKEDALIKDIKSLELTRAMIDGKASQQQLNITFIFVIVGFIFSGIGVLCSLTGLLLSVYLH